MLPPEVTSIFTSGNTKMVSETLFYTFTIKISPAFYTFAIKISPAFYAFTIKISPAFYKILLNILDYQIFIESLQKINNRGHNYDLLTLVSSGSGWKPAL